MKIDYKKELEAASKSMILIHDPKVLIRLMVRMIVRKVKVKHAAMILYDPLKDAYVLTISKGEAGLKVPAGFARFKKDSPLIRLFTRKEMKILPKDRDTLVSGDLEKMMWRESVIANGDGNKELLKKVSEQLQMFNAAACVPAYFRDNLLAILLLGEKKDGSPFHQEELNFFSALASDVAMAIRNARLFEDLKEEADRNRQLFINTTIALTSAIEAKDAYTRGHTERVTRYALDIAHQMAENGSVKFTTDFYEHLYIAGLLHDVGKIAVPESILLKKGGLTGDEFNTIKSHPLRGVEIVKHIPEFEECLEGIKYHHERYDGKGYPEGLKGDQIPMIAAVLSVADTFDAMTSDRPYRKGLSKEVAIAEIRKNSGIQFNPLAARAMVELFEIGEI